MRLASALAIAAVALAAVPATAPAAKKKPFRPVLTYEGESSPMLTLADKEAENLQLWKEELWRHVPGFYWHYPVSDLKPGAVSLLGHPEKKIGRRSAGQQGTHLLHAVTAVRPQPRFVQTRDHELRIPPRGREDKDGFRPGRGRREAAARLRRGHRSVLLHTWGPL